MRRRHKVWPGSVCADGVTTDARNHTDVQAVPRRAFGCTASDRPTTRKSGQTADDGLRRRTCPSSSPLPARRVTRMSLAQIMPWSESFTDGARGGVQRTHRRDTASSTSRRSSGSDGDTGLQSGLRCRPAGCPGRRRFSYVTINLYAWHAAQSATRYAGKSTRGYPLRAGGRHVGTPCPVLLRPLFDLSRLVYVSAAPRSVRRGGLRSSMSRTGNPRCIGRRRSDCARPCETWTAQRALPNREPRRHPALATTWLRGR